jgi:hypothetical protein
MLSPAVLKKKLTRTYSKSKPLLINKRPKKKKSVHFCLAQTPPPPTPFFNFIFLFIPKVTILAATKKAKALPILGVLRV